MPVMARRQPSGSLDRGQAHCQPTCLQRGSSRCGKRAFSRLVSNESALGCRGQGPNSIAVDSSETPHYPVWAAVYVALAVLVVYGLVAPFEPAATLTPQQEKPSASV